MNKWKEFEETKEKKEKILYVPEQRAHRGCPKIEFPKVNRWGYGLKIAIRQIAKRMPEYHLPVKNSFLPITVETQEGDKIEVNTLGRWAFGVPGYMGHLIFEGGESDKIIIYYPQNSPAELIKMLEKAISLL